MSLADCARLILCPQLIAEAESVGNNENYVLLDHISTQPLHFTFPNTPHGARLMLNTWFLLLHSSQPQGKHLFD